MNATSKMDKLDNEMYARIAFGVGAVMGVILIMMLCYCVCNGDAYCESFRERNIVSPEDIQSISAIEMQPPSYEEAARVASTLATRRRRRRRRRNNRHDSITSDNANYIERGETDTQLDGEATGDSNTGDSCNDNEKNRRTCTRNDDSGFAFNLGKECEVNSDSRGKRGNKSTAADDSGIKSDSGNDTVDKCYDISINSKYDTASGSSGGGGDSRALSP